MKIKPCSLAILLCVVFFTVVGCSSFFKRTPAEVRTDRKHYIMTIHGLRGDKNSFGDFHELIKTHLEKIDPGYSVVPLNYVYSTANEDYTTYGAAQEIKNQLIRDVPILNLDDKISVVSYSMGSQIALAWYFSSLKDPQLEKYPLQTVNMISLGAAYWGAQEAGLLSNDINLMKRTLKAIILEINKSSQVVLSKYSTQILSNALQKLQNLINTKTIFPTIDKLQSVEQVKYFYDKTKIKDIYPNPLAKVLDSNETLKKIRNSTIREITKASFAEIESLATASENINKLRLELTHPKPPITRWISVSSLIQCFETDLGAQKNGCNDFQTKTFANINSGLAKYSFGHTRRESDNAINTPSSIAQFNYVIDNNSNYINNELISEKRFQNSISDEDHKVIFVETLHATAVTHSVYDSAISFLGKFGKSWERLADDVALIYRDTCMSPKTCNHPVYKYILTELAHCNQKKSTCDINQLNDFKNELKFTDQNNKEAQEKLKSELHGFSVDFNLLFPKNYDLNQINETTIFNHLKTNFTDDSNRILADTNSTDYLIYFGRRLELNSILVKKRSTTLNEELNVSITGLITAEDNKNYNYQKLQDYLTFNLSLEFPGLKSRQVQIPIKPFNSTYLSLTFAR